MGVKGGCPSDNNMPESLNNVQKKSVANVTSSLVKYVNPNNPTGLIQFMENRSRKDLEFGEYLNTAVHNLLFYKSAMEMAVAPVSPSITSFAWVGGVTGERVISSQRTINLLLDDDEFEIESSESSERRYEENKCSCGKCNQCRYDSCSVESWYQSWMS